MTFQQKNTLDFIKQYIYKYDISPTTAEIAVGIGIKSRGVVYRYLKELQNLGMIEITPNKKRNIVMMHAANDDINKEPQAFLPMLGKISAGSAIEIIHNNEQFNFIDKLVQENRYILQVDGDSMLGDNIFHGDYIICEYTNKIGYNDIAIVVIDNTETALKRCRFNYQDDEVTLISSNLEYAPKVYSLDRVAIQGKFVGLLRIAD